MHERNPAPPKKPWSDDAPVNTNKTWFQPWFQKWCEMDFAHPQYLFFPLKKGKDPEACGRTSRRCLCGRPRHRRGFGPKTGSPPKIGEGVSRAPWTKSRNRTTVKPEEPNVCWYLQGNRLIPRCLRWCEMDFATIRSMDQN